MKKIKCPECDGKKTIVSGDHNPNCDGEHCSQFGCDLPVVECPSCNGTGEVEMPPCAPNSAHRWDEGVRTEGVMGGYMYTCKICGMQKPGWRVRTPSNKPDTKVRMSKKARRKARQINGK